MAKLLQKYGIGVLFTLVAIIVVIGLQALGVLDLAAYKLLDYSFQVRGPLSSWASRTGVPADSLDVVLIDVDDESYRILGDYGYPFPRGRIWVPVIRNLVDGGAKVIVFDIQFDSRDGDTAEKLRVYGDNLPEDFIDGDRQLAEAILYARSQGCEVILSSTIKNEPSSVPPENLVISNEFIMEADAEHGLVDMYSDLDGFQRRYPTFSYMRHEPETWIYSLGLKAIKYYLDIPNSDTLTYDKETNSFEYGPLRIPRYKQNTFMSNIYGQSSKARIGESDAWGTFKRIPVAWVLDTEDFDLPIQQEDTDWMSTFDPSSSFNAMMLMIDPEFEVMQSPFLGKICVIGVSVETVLDYKKTAFYSYMGSPTEMPGYEFHANGIQTILDGNYIRVLGDTIEFSRNSAFIQILMILGLALIAYALLVLFDPLWGGLLILVEALILFSIGIGVFTNDIFWLFKLILGNRDAIGVPGLGGSLVVPIIPPLVAVALTYVTNVLYKFIVEQKDKHFLKNTFGTYISPELIDKMYEEKQEPKLGGDEGIHTAFFTDIQSFSAFSEVLTPPEVVELLNEYLTDMTDILLQNQGTLDKYIGDAIVAFYGAPVPVEDHEYLACLTAVEMQERLDELRLKWQNEGERWPDIVQNMQNRIGISTGKMVTGNMGSAMRMNYTMMGDVVNLAARLESSAKQYGVYIQVAEPTYQVCKDKFEWRELDYVMVKGKTVPVQVYELLSRKGELKPEYAGILKAYNEGLELYKNQSWDKAREAFIAADELEDMFPFRPTNPSRFYVPRCEYYKENPPGDDWDGSFKLTAK